jgi:hypothetical protein
VLNDYEVRFPLFELSPIHWEFIATCSYTVPLC